MLLSDSPLAGRLRFRKLKVFLDPVDRINAFREAVHVIGGRRSKLLIAREETEKRDKQMTLFITMMRIS